MALRLVDDGNSSGDDRAALADARQTVVGARLRLQALADRLADLRRRVSEGAPAGQTSVDSTSGETPPSTGYGSLPPSGSSGSS